MQAELSTRSKFLLVTIISLLPVYGLIFYNSWFYSELTINEAKSDLQNQSEKTESDIDFLIRGTVNLLNSLSFISDFRKLENTKSCYLLDRILAQDFRYSNGFIALPNGQIHCSTDSGNILGNELDQAYFRRALVSGKVEVGSPSICISSNKFCFPMALALRDGSGKVISVIILSLDPIWIFKQEETIWKEPLTSMIWWGSESNISFAWPNPNRWSGKFLTNNNVGINMIGQTSGHFIADDIDGVIKVFGFATIRGIGYPDLKLSLSVPRENYLNYIKREMINHLTSLTLILIVALSFAWILAGIVIKRLTLLTQFARQIGVFNRRSNNEQLYTGTNKRKSLADKNFSDDEFGKLAFAINSAVDTQVSKINGLKKIESQLRLIIKRLAEGVTLYKLNGQLMFFSTNKNNDNKEFWLHTTLQSLTTGVELYDPHGFLLYRFCRD